KILRGYHWPGNLRELSNLVARMHAISPTAVMDITTVPKSLLPARICEAIQSIASRGRSVAAEAHTGPMMDAQGLMDDRLEQALGFTQSDVPLPKDGFALKDLLQDIEVNVIRKALDSTQWNVSSAAKLLDMHRTTLIQKISKLDIAQDNSPVTN
ncbi:MAG: helix-turn-helix domain-containing protein, partial [Pseudomonadales bacterium]